MTALQRAFALAQIDDIAEAIAQHLNFDMTRLLNVLLDEHPFIAEGGTGFVGGAFEAVAAFVVIPGNPHPLAAAAGTGLDHHWIADFQSDLDRFLGVFNDFGVTGHGADPGQFG